MMHYNFHETFRGVYDRARSAFDEGATDAAALLGPADLAFLRAIGGRAQDMFDYAEDMDNHGEPGFEIALLIEAVRRDYFLTVQQGVPSGHVLDLESLPAKTDAVRGLEWLPRIIPKAKAKLRGELPMSLMYCCGGDRRFFKQHDIHPAEFLRAVWTWEDDDERIIDWVEARARTAAAAAPAGA